VATHRLARTLPAEEQDGLAAELRRTGYGIPGAIAAGNAVWERAEYARALVAAQGLLARLETLVATGVALGAVSAADEAALLAVCAEVRRLIGGLARATRAGGRAPASAPTPAAATASVAERTSDAPAGSPAAAPPPSVTRGGRRRAGTPA
jgi:four helix bundle protein